MPREVFEMHCGNITVQVGCNSLVLEVAVTAFNQHAKDFAS